MFERIGDVLPRFRAYERLFPNNERLVQSLSVVYLDILKFCSDVKTVFRRGKRSSGALLASCHPVFSSQIDSWRTSDQHKDILEIGVETIRHAVRRPLEQVPRAQEVRRERSRALTYDRIC